MNQAGSKSEVRSALKELYLRRAAVWKPVTVFSEINHRTIKDLKSARARPG